MEVFDVRDDYPELLIKKPSGDVKVTIHPVSKSVMKKITSLENRMKKAGGDFEKQFAVMLEMMATVCPELKESDLIDVPITKLVPLVNRVIELSTGFDISEVEKKIPEPRKRRSSPSRKRRASA